MKDDYLTKGLSSLDVLERIKKGQVNVMEDETIKTPAMIIFSNVFNLFNALNLFLALLVVLSGHFRNMLFMGVVITNTVIGIFQEIRSYHKLNKLRLLNAPHATIIRDGQEAKITGDKIVLDDLLRLGIGQEVLSDVIVLNGEVLVLEAMLTGESDEIYKQKGDKIYAGSIITKGEALCKVVAVGQDNYIAHIAKKVKRAKRQPSRLRDALDFIVKMVAIIILPLGILLFLKQYLISGLDLDDALLQSVASMVGMIPEGLVLLTSIALSVGALNLSFKNTLVQELYSLETLARVDVLCLDKTGTLTSGKMEVLKMEKFEEFNEYVFANIVHELNDQNATGEALQNYFKPQKRIHLDKLIHFSSRDKHSGAEYNKDLYLIGACQFICDKINSFQKARIDHYAEMGNRVIGLSINKKLVALLIIKDELRPNVKKTLAYFLDQGVDLKIISGDDETTIRSIAQSAGFRSYDKSLNCLGLKEDELKDKALDYAIFARVNPDQKIWLIEALKKSGHTIGMVGDGVNDVMALKEADFSIALGSAMESAKNIANVVLLDNDFNHMIAIIKEGRRVINNIQRTATLFLTKTLLSIILALLAIVVLTEFPFAPIQLTLLSSLLIGMPAFFLSFEPNYDLVKGGFLSSVLKKALPCALSIILAVLILEVLIKLDMVKAEHVNTMATLISALIMYVNVARISKPLNLFRILILSFAFLGLFLAFIFFREIFYLEALALNEIILAFILSSTGVFIMYRLDRLKIIKHLISRIDEKY